VSSATIKNSTGNLLQLFKNNPTKLCFLDFAMIQT